MRWTLLLVLVAGCTESTGGGGGGTSHTARQVLQLPLPSLGLPCWDVPLADIDATTAGLQTECTAEIAAPDPDVLARCVPSSTVPCYSIVTGEQGCISTGISTKLERIPQVAGTITIECLVEDSP